MQPGDITDAVADVAALKRDMNFAPSTSIEEGVAQFVTWYREYHGV
jgi:UDP-glucuronate 4-epimerase